MVAGRLDFRKIKVSKWTLQNARIQVHASDLEAKRDGRMLTATTEVNGLAAYVVVEHVTGKLGGAAGSFMLRQTGTMSAEILVQM